MCRICDGLTYEELYAETAAAIASHGYTLIGVEGGAEAGRLPWFYTVGLLDAADHAELIIAGVDPKQCVPALNAIASEVLEGNAFGVGETINVGIGVARVGAVHPIQYDLDTFNAWHTMQDFGA